MPVEAFIYLCIYKCQLTPSPSVLAKPQFVSCYFLVQAPLAARL